MAFSNPVVGGTTLIREAIHSPDYVPGVSGWTINRDGSAEFNDVIIRGGLVVSGTDGVIVEDSGGGPRFSLAAQAGTHNGFPYPEGFAYQFRDPNVDADMVNRLHFESFDNGDGYTSGIYARRMNGGNPTSEDGAVEFHMFNGASTAPFTVISSPSNDTVHPRQSDIILFGRNDTGTLDPFAQVNGGLIVPDMRPVDADNPNNITGFTNTTYSAGSGSDICGVSFVAPRSGQGKLVWHARVENNASPATLTDRVNVSAGVLNGGTIGSGTTFLAPTDNYSVEVTGFRMQAAMYRPVTGLTAGQTYNAVVYHSVAGGSGDIFHRSLRWEPDL